MQWILQMKRAEIVVVVCVLSLLAACEKYGTVAQLSREIRIAAPEKRRAIWDGLPPDRRIAVYLYTATHVEPPVILANDLAIYGSEILPAIRAALGSETDAKRVNVLLLLLVAMSKSTCSLSPRNDVISTATQAVARVGLSDSSAAKASLASITDPTSRLPACK